MDSGVKPPVSQWSWQSSPLLLTSSRVRTALAGVAAQLVAFADDELDGLALSKNVQG
jgi:hypothetical protein